MLSHQDLKVVATFLGVMGVGSGVVWVKSGGPFMASSSVPRVIGVHPQAPGPAVPKIIAPINMNTATADEFEHLPGIGPMLARRIVRARSEGGRFEKVEDLRRVKGIGPKLFAKISPYLVVEIPQSSIPNRQSSMDHP